MSAEAGSRPGTPAWQQRQPQPPRQREACVAAATHPRDVVGHPGPPLEVVHAHGGGVQALEAQKAGER
jgi:hypothetical protein